MWGNGCGGVQAAHAQLVSSSGRLREQGQACPNQLMRTLMLLHSYILVKTLVRMGDHVVSTPSGAACTCQTRLYWSVSACPCPVTDSQVVPVLAGQGFTLSQQGPCLASKGPFKAL